MKLKHVRNVLCVIAVSAAVALSGASVNAPAMVVQAEETQVNALDDILRQMYALYQSGEIISMYTLDASDTVAAYAEMVKNSGADRYVISLDDNTKAMMYVTADGGYWWYFGQMENNLRQGTGTTILLNSNYYETYTGSYHADFPGGNGTYSIHWYEDGNGYDVTGTFQGMKLNGTYQVNAAWIDYDTYSSSLPITYTDNIITAITGWELDVTTDDWGTTYYSVSDSLGDGYIFDVENGSCLSAAGWSQDGSSSYWTKTNVSETFSAVLRGNATPAPAAPNTPAPDVPAVEITPAPDVPAAEITPAPTTPAVPLQPSVSGTYVVQRGDNLSRIAEKAYGDRTQWKKIYEANKNTIRKDYVIFANQTLVIPAQ